MINLDSLSKNYADTEVFANVSLTVMPGSITVLKGHSGCGKSTLLKCMSLQIPFNNGTISIEDRIVSAEESDSKKFRNTLLRNAKISMVFQQLYLWPHLTCIDNIKLVSPTFDCLSLAKELRIDAILGSFPDRVSLGQAQRVAYIRSLASNPKYLFLDEVTSALDHESTRLISKSINAKKEEGVGIFLITHSEEFSNQLNRDATMEMENGELSFLP